MAEDFWKLYRGEGPLVAAAIHNGRLVRDEVLRHMTLTEQDRLYEEDPFTASWTGEADPILVGAIGSGLSATVPGVLQELDRL